jgi:hypothetical protein
MANITVQGQQVNSVTNGTNQINCRLGGVVVSLLAAGPKGRGFKPGRGDGFLRVTKIRSTPSFG